MYDLENMLFIIADIMMIPAGLDSVKNRFRRCVNHLRNHVERYFFTGVILSL